LIDWSQCKDAERVPDRCGGAWVVKGTRVPVKAILDNVMAGCTIQPIAGFELILMAHTIGNLVNGEITPARVAAVVTALRGLRSALEPVRTR
jgi:hypothetical protein